VPYPPRIGTAGLVFHVINRGVRRAQLFSDPADYSAFLTVFAQAQARIPLRILAYCVMPNHFHVVVWPLREKELSSFMRWMTATHSKRWHKFRATTGTGSVYQGRFKAFPIQNDGHFLTVCRYVEQNPLRARLVQRAEDWRWSSLADRCRNCHQIALEEWPIVRPSDWLTLVNEVDTTALSRIRKSIAKNRPYGTSDWVKQVAGELKVTRSLRGVGRPRTSEVILRNP
jgi:putative transposase